MDLIVVDEYMDEIGTYLRDKQMEKLRDIKSEYYAIMKKLIEEGISEGETADALKEFIAELTDIDLGKVGSEAKRYCSSYVDEIDDADEELY